MEPNNNESDSNETRDGELHQYTILIKEPQEKRQYNALHVNSKFDESDIYKKSEDINSGDDCSGTSGSICFVDKSGYILNGIISDTDSPANFHGNSDDPVYIELDCDDKLPTKYDKNETISVSFSAEDTNAEKIKRENETDRNDQSNVNETEKKVINNEPSFKISNNCYVEWIKENKKISAVIGMMAIIILVLIVIMASTVSKPNNKDLNEGDVACSWSDWTTWTDCPLLPFKGTQQRTKYLKGPEVYCKPNETVQTKTCEDTRFNFDLKYDTALVNPELFLAGDNTILSNYQIDVRDNNGLLQNYSGATADHCLTANSKMYFVVAYNITVIMDNFDDEGTVLFEAAFSDREQIDKFPYVGENPNGWSFNVFHQQFDSYALAAQRFTDEKILKIFQVANGATITGKLEILVDRERDELSLVDGSRVEHVFMDFKSDNLLCPMFGLYGDGKAKMSLQIRDAKNLTDLFHHFWT